MPEETKPVEREAFNKFLASRKMGHNDVLILLIEDVWQASADAALERAAGDVQFSVKQQLGKTWIVCKTPNGSQFAIELAHDSMEAKILRDALKGSR